MRLEAGSGAGGVPADANLSGHDVVIGASARSVEAPGEIVGGLPNVPPGTPRDAEVAINRLVELTAILARRAGQLQRALDSRIAIEQAKGILAERYGLSVEEAFRILRRSARSRRMRLHDLATLVVASPITPEEIRTPTLDGR